MFRVIVIGNEAQKGNGLDNNMAKEAGNYTVRINLRTKEDYERFKLLETLLCVKGRDMTEFYSEIIKSGIRQYAGIVNHETFVDSERLRSEIEKRLGKVVTRVQMNRLRNTVWVEDEDYYSAPSGESRVFRYDLEKCLAKLEEAILPAKKDANVCQKDLAENNECGKFENRHEF